MLTLPFRIEATIIILSVPLGFFGLVTESQVIFKMAVALITVTLVVTFLGSVWGLQ